MKKPDSRLNSSTMENYKHFLYMFDQYIEQDWAEVLSSNFGADLSTFYEQDIKNHIARYCVTQTFHFDSNFYLVGTSRARAMYASSMRGHCTKFTTFKDFSYQDGQVAKGKQNWPVDQVEVKK